VEKVPNIPAIQNSPRPAEMDATWLAWPDGAILVMGVQQTTLGIWLVGGSDA
jgi:hypothetical protein